MLDGLRIGDRVPTWHAAALCRQFGELDWVDAPPDSAQHLACRMLCNACPVKHLCAATALAAGEPWGIHGGLDPADRRTLAAAHGFPRPATVAPHGTDRRYKKGPDVHLGPGGCRCWDCRRAHAEYERGRRADVRHRQVLAARTPLPGTMVLTARCGRGRRAAGPGQLCLPLPGVDPPAGAEPVDQPDDQPDDQSDDRSGDIAGAA